MHRAENAFVRTVGNAFVCVADTCLRIFSPYAEWQHMAALVILRSASGALCFAPSSPGIGGKTAKTP